MAEENNVSSIESAHKIREEARKKATESKLESFDNDMHKIAATRAYSENIALEDITVVIDTYLNDIGALHEDMIHACKSFNQKDTVTTVLEYIPADLTTEAQEKITSSETYKQLAEHCTDSYSKERNCFTATLCLKKAPPHLYISRKSQQLPVFYILAVDIEFSELPLP